MPPPPTKAFDLYLFSAALKAGKLEKAKAELTKCIGHEAEIRQVYGETHLRSTPLYHILEGPLTGSREEAKALLEHSVMRSVIQLKWEAFGMRMYLEQLLMYGVLLLSMTLSVATSYARRPTDAFPVQVFVWAVAMLSLLLSLLACRFFSYRRKELWCLVTSSVCALVGGVLYANTAVVEAALDYATFVACNHATLLLSGAYFLLFELAELFGEVPAESRVVHVARWPRWLQRGAYWVCVAPFDVLGQFALMLLGRSEATYYSSFFNALQMPTFFVVTGYAIAQLVLTPDAGNVPQLVFGTILTFLLWALSVQYLEVHGTAGFLIPMMRAMLLDVSRFLAFYLPFQLAFTFAYYLLFQSLPDTSPYDSLPKSFLQTFLVLLQQFDASDFANLPTMSAVLLGYTLLLTHATLVMVMLLNVLIAMMTKGVEARMEKAKREALVSFAECVLRSEKTQGLIPLPARTELQPQEVAPLIESSRGLYLGDDEDDDDDVKVDHGHSVVCFGAAEESRLGFRPDELSSDERLAMLTDQVARLEATVASLVQLLGAKRAT